MLLDWFTIVAQIINFLVLVWLLKRFLYGPIVKAMETREARIAARLEQAEQARTHAEHAAQGYDEKMRALETEQTELLAQAKQDVENERKQLIRQARAQVQEMQTRWFHDLERERAEFLRDLRQRASEHMYFGLRRTLADLANAELQEQMVDVFLARLQNPDEPVRVAMQEAAQAHGSAIRVRSAFELPMRTRHKLTAELESNLQVRDIFFETAPELQCGIEIQTDGYELGWSLDAYLDELQSEINKTLDEMEQGIEE